ncbi:MAG: hypothetical protein ABI949_01085 [Ilumatobacteraceae bacterium]
MVGRRRFLLLGLGGSAAALIGGTALKAAADSPAVTQVWRLSADWGYAVPPKGRTRCSCRACRSHAANKVFATRAVALANRIHPCCVCQPYSVDLLTADAVTLFVGSPSGNSIDLRNDDARARFDAAVVRSLAPPPDPTAPPTLPDPTAPVIVVSPPAPGATSNDSSISLGTLLTSRATDAASSAAPQTGTLPVTGGDHDTLLAAAAVLVVAGVAAVAGSSIGSAD